MAELIGSVVMPGDRTTHTQRNEDDESKKILLGPGVKEEDNFIVVTKPGILKFRDPKVYWVDAHQKRYIPCKGDSVLGIVTQKVGDIFRVDIGGSELASLSYLSFEAATKKYRPNVKVGDLVYAKLLVANKDMEPELVCIDSSGRSSGMGVIHGEGFVFTTSLNLIRKLLSPQCALLTSLGKHFRFETAIGVNGRVWIKAESDMETIAISNAMQAAELMSNEQIKSMCAKLSKVVSGLGS